MRQYEKPSTIGRSLGYPPDGKRFGRALVEMGLRESTGKPTQYALDRRIATKVPRYGGRWAYDVDAVIVRVMGGWCPPEIATEAEAIGTELAAVDAACSARTQGAELVALGERWDTAMRRVTPRHVPRVNGMLRREGAPFRLCQDGQVEMIKTRKADTAA